MRFMCSENDYAGVLSFSEDTTLCLRAIVIFLAAEQSELEPGTKDKLK